MVIFLVLLGAAIGGGIGVGVAVYFLQNRNPTEQETAVPDTSSSPVPEAAELAAKIAQGETVRETPSRRVKAETGKKRRESTARKEEGTSKTEPKDTVPTVAVVKKDTSKGLRLEGGGLKAEAPKSTGTDISAPTIDLSSTIDLNTPKPRPTTGVPTVTPELKPKTTPSLTISSLSESEIKKVYYTEGNLAKAERMLRKELKQNPRSALAKKYLRLIKLERQALALEAQGDSEGAKRIWQQILKIAPDHPRAKKHLR